MIRSCDCWIHADAVNVPITTSNDLFLVQLPGESSKRTNDSELPSCPIQISRKAGYRAALARFLVDTPLVLLPCFHHHPRSLHFKPHTCSIRMSAENTEEFEDLQEKFGRLRIVIVGRANAGKTMILRGIYNSTENPEIYQGVGVERVERGQMER